MTIGSCSSVPKHIGEIVTRTYTHNGHTHQIMLHDMSDEQMANKVRMLMRTDLDHELVCQAARDRIKCLSQEKAAFMAWLDSEVQEGTCPEFLAAIRKVRDKFAQLF